MEPKDVLSWLGFSGYELSVGAEVCSLGEILRTWKIPFWRLTPCMFLHRVNQ